MVTTIVSGELGQKIARENGIDVQQVLTGFKYIGDKAEGFPEQGRHFFFGYEESYGYLTGSLRAIRTPCLPSRWWAKWRSIIMSRARTSTIACSNCAKKYGYFVERHHLQGGRRPRLHGKIDAIMAKFRDPALKDMNGLTIRAVEDYETGLRTERKRRRDLPSWTSQGGCAQALLRLRHAGGSSLRHRAQDQVLLLGQRRNAGKGAAESCHR